MAPRAGEVARWDRRDAPHPERFSPEEHGGRLMEAEHRGRYWWAAQLAAEKDVLDAACGTGYGMEILASAGPGRVVGVDVDPAAAAEAARRCGDPEAVVQADVRELPFETGSFDLVVSWETIEHVEGGERVLDELHRVLRPDGLLLISSPNPDVYPPGNEHHVHEYRPTELAALVGERFVNVASYRQHAWLASVIESNGAHRDGFRSRRTGADRRELRTTQQLEAGAEAFGLVLAGDGPLPRLDDLVVLGGDFEVSWWREQVTGAELRAGAQVEEVESRTRGELDRIEREARAQLVTAEAEAEVQVAGAEAEASRRVARVEAREVELQQRLRETSAALLDANQDLAQLPVLRHQLQAARLESDGLRELVTAYGRSTSWRLTAPLRRLGRLLPLRRR